MKNAPPVATDGARERRFQCSGVLLDTTSAVVNRFPADHVFSGLRRNDYRCVTVDAPTTFLAGTKGQPHHYARMSDSEIAELPVADLFHPEGAWLFFWVTSPKAHAPPGSKRLLSPAEIAWARVQEGHIHE